MRGDSLTGPSVEVSLDCRYICSVIHSKMGGCRGLSLSFVQHLWPNRLHMCEQGFNDMDRNGWGKWVGRLAIARNFGFSSKVNRIAGFVWMMVATGDGCSALHIFNYVNNAITSKSIYIFRFSAIWIFVGDFSRRNWGFVILTDIWEVPLWKCVYRMQSIRILVSVSASFEIFGIAIHRIDCFIHWDH